MRKLATVGRPCRRSPSSDRMSARARSRGQPVSGPAPPTDASLRTSSRMRCSWARCQLSRSEVAVNPSAAAAIDRTHSPTALGWRRSSSATSNRSMNSAKRPARSIGPAVDVIEGQNARRRAADLPQPWRRREGTRSRPDPPRVGPTDVGRACTAPGGRRRAPSEHRWRRPTPRPGRGHRRLSGNGAARLPPARSSTSAAV